MSKRKSKGKCLACEKPLTGKQRYWCSQACRHWLDRQSERESNANERESSGFERESSGLEQKSGSFFPERRLQHEIAILRKKVDPNSTGTLSRDYTVTFEVKFSEKYDTQRPETELFSLVNHKILAEFVQRVLEDYNPGWKVVVRVKKRRQGGD